MVAEAAALKEEAEAVAAEAEEKAKRAIAEAVFPPGTQSQDTSSYKTTQVVC